MKKWLGPWGRLRILGTVAFLYLAAASAFAADEALLKQAEELLKAGKAEQAYQLLEPLEPANAGDLVYDYLLGTAALESGRPSKATFVYERILAVEPGYVGVRADMGRAYLALGDYARAKIEFEAVLSYQNLPPDLKTAVERYASAAEARAQAKKTVVAAYAEVGVGRDSNVGSATSVQYVPYPLGTIGPLDPPNRKAADNYAALALGAEVNHAFSDQVGGYVGADLRTRSHRHYDTVDNTSLDARAGLSYSGGRWLLRGGVLAGTYELDNDRLRDNRGVNADWRYALSGTSQVSVGGSWIAYRYVPEIQQPNDYDAANLSLGWTQALSASTVASLSLALGHENARRDRDDGDKNSWGPRILVQTSFSPTLGGFATVGATRSDYRQQNTTFNVTREETLYDATLGVTYALAKGVSLRPQFVYVKNASNIELYKFNRADFSVNARWDF